MRIRGPSWRSEPSSQMAGAPPPRKAGDEAAELGGSGEPPDPGLVDGVVELLGGEGERGVEERAGDGGGGHAIARPIGDGAAAMDDDAVDADSSVRDGDVELWR